MHVITTVNTQTSLVIFILTYGHIYLHIYIFKYILVLETIYAHIYVCNLISKFTFIALIIAELWAIQLAAGRCQLP